MRLTILKTGIIIILILILSSCGKKAKPTLDDTGAIHELPLQKITNNRIIYARQDCDRD